jgi:hypothetical protein
MWDQIAARDARPSGRRPGSIIVVGIALAALVAVLSVVTLVMGPSESTRSYSEFLDDVAAGRVSTVTQVGTLLEVEADGGAYEVTVPDLLTDVFGNIQAVAAPDDLPSFQAQPAADPMSLAIPAILVANLVVMAGVLALAVVLVRRRPTASG